MNTKLTSLVVLGVIAMSAPAFAAKANISAPAKGAKVCAKHKANTVSLKKKTTVASVKKAAK